MISVVSGSGGECRIACPGIESVTVKNGRGETVKTVSDREGRIKFTSAKGARYTMVF